jgi:hypothetical protein
MLILMHSVGQAGMVWTNNGQLTMILCRSTSLDWSGAGLRRLTR